MHWILKLVVLIVGLLWLPCGCGKMVGRPVAPSSGPVSQAHTIFNVTDMYRLKPVELSSVPRETIADDGNVSVSIVVKWWVPIDPAAPSRLLSVEGYVRNKQVNLNSFSSEQIIAHVKKNLEESSLSRDRQEELGKLLAEFFN